MITNSIVFIILGILDVYVIIIDKLNNINYTTTQLVFYFIFLNILTIAYSLEDVLNKIALSRESLTPYSLLFYKGLFQIPLVIITTICLIFIINYKYDKSNFISIFKEEKKLIFQRGIFIIFTMLRSIFLVKVIDKFSSQHLSILKVLESLFMFIFFLIEKKYRTLFIPFISLSFLIITFTSLVYNEILVINLCGLQDYTQHGLDIQAEKDLRDAATEINELSSDISEDDSKSESFVIKNVSYTD